VAVKVFGDNQIMEQREIAILKSCRDRNIVQFLGVMFDPQENRTMMVTELMENGDLYKALHGQNSHAFRWYKRCSPRA
jgi:serine/threonine protein kinase